MKFSQCAVLIALLLTVSTSTGYISNDLSAEDLNPHFYCGRKLARALALLCFDEESVEKRSDGKMFNAILESYYKDQETHQFGLPWIPHHKARGVAMGRGKRLVVSECCEKACSVSELMMYC